MNIHTQWKKNGHEVNGHTKWKVDIVEEKFGEASANKNVINEEISNVANGWTKCGGMMVW